MTFRNRVRIILISAAAIAAGVFFLSQADRKKAVESLLHKGRAAIESENMDRLAPVLSIYYLDDLGLSYASLRGSFEYVFSQFNNLSVDYRVTGISPGKDTVTADLTVWARGEWMGVTQDLAGTENEPVPVSILFKRELFRMKVIGSRWPRGRAGLRQFN